MLRWLMCVLCIVGCKRPQSPVIISPPAENIGVLAPVSTVEEAKAAIAGFSWRDAPALPETNPDGSPALYYASIYVHDRAQLHILSDLAIRHSALPLFHAEWKPWRGIGHVAPTHTVGQEVRFAIVPGHIFNLLRKAKGPVVDAIVLRDVPPAAKLPNGALSYEVVARTRWFKETTATRSGDLIPSIATIRAFAADAAEAARDISHGIASKLGELDRDGLAGIGGRGAVTLSIELQLYTTDPAFAAPIWKSNGLTLADPPGRMVRMWGQGFGRPIALHGVRVSVMSTADFGVVTLFDGTTDANGVVSLQVAKDRPLDSICIELSNDAATVTDFLAPIETCGFKDYLDGAGLNTMQRNTRAILRLQDPYINVLAQATDGRDFLSEMVGYTPHTATILVGDLADTIASFGSGAGTTACLGFPDPHTDSLAIALGSVVSAIGLPAEIVPIFLVDSWIPENGGRTRSRISPTHEYGHYAMCSMMFDHDPLAFAAGFFVAAVERIKDGNHPPPSSESAVNLEAFADFFASQVVGGVRYFDPGNTFEASVGNNSTSRLCNSQSPDCMDHNWASDPTPTWGSEIRRAATTLHDAFDGHFPDANVWAPKNEPGNADAWTQSNGLIVPGFRHGGDAHDENVALSGPAIKTFVEGLSELDNKTFMGSLTSTMKKAGYGWCDICQLYALHTLHATTPTASMVDVCRAKPISDWLDPPRPGETCAARPPLQFGCPSGKFVLNDGYSVTCVDACPEPWHPDGNECKQIVR